MATTAAVVCWAASLVLGADTSELGELQSPPSLSAIDTLTSDIIAPAPMLEAPSQCAVRPETVVEINRMQAEATQYAQAMEYERHAMEKRKAYIESATAFLNARIMELNKVKSNLRSEKKWMQLTEAKIMQLQAQQRAAKIQDIMSCLTNEKHFNEQQATQKTTMMETLKAKSDEITASLEQLSTQIAAIEKGDGTAAAAGEAHHHHLRDRHFRPGSDRYMGFSHPKGG